LIVVLIACSVDSIGKGRREMKKTLYLYVATLDVGCECLLLFTFYASSTIEAMEHVINLEVEYEARCLGYKVYPGGFKIVMSELPGVIDTTSLPQ
jgi:hypothetical protein